MTWMLPGGEYDCPECGTHFVLKARACPGCVERWPLDEIKLTAWERWGQTAYYWVLGVFVLLTLLVWGGQALARMGIWTS